MLSICKTGQSGSCARANCFCLSRHCLMSRQPSPEPRRLFCVLSAATLSCYLGPEEPDAEARPALRLPVNKVGRSPSRRTRALIEDDNAAEAARSKLV